MADKTKFLDEAGLGKVFNLLKTLLGDVDSTLTARIKAIEDQIGKWDEADWDTIAEAVAALQTDLTAAEGRLDTIQGDESAAGSIKKAVKDAKDALEGLISDEVTRAKGAEKDLQDAITKLNGDENTDGSVAKAVKDAQTELETKIAAEATTARAAEKANADAIAAEKTRAEGVESDLDTRVKATFKNVEYKQRTDTENALLVFTKDDGTTQSIDVQDFVIDGMVSGVEVKDNKLVITFNTDSKKETIEIEITKIFNAANYYTKEEVDGIKSELETAISDEETRATTAEQNLQTAIDRIDGTDAVDGSFRKAIKDAKTELDGEISGLDTRLTTAEGKLATIQGDENTAGSIAKALKDAKDYTDTEAAKCVKYEDALTDAEIQAKWDAVFKTSEP